MPEGNDHHDESRDAPSAKETLAERVAKIQRRVAEAGFVSTGSDIQGDKAFMDDLSGEI